MSAPSASGFFSQAMTVSSHQRKEKETQAF